MPAPSESHIKKFVEDRTNAYAEQHKMIVRNRELRYREHEVKVPAAYATTTTVMKSPVIADVDARVVATLTKEDPVVSVPPYADTEKAKRNSSLREGWTQAALKQMQRDANRPVFRMGIDGAVSDSLRVWKLIDNKEAWKNFPRRRKDEERDDNLSNEENTARAARYLERSDKFAKGQPFPFSWTDLDPLTYFPDRTSGIPTEVAEVSERSLIPAMESFGVRRTRGMAQKFEKVRMGEPVSEDESEVGQTVKCIEHWYMHGDGKTTTLSYLLDGELIDQRTLTNYPRVPYFPVGGHMTSSRDPEHQYASVVQPFAHLVPALDAMLTMSMNRLYLFGYPFMKRTNAKGVQVYGPEDPAGATQIEPGDLLEDVEFMGEIGPSSIIKDMVGLVMQMMDRSGLSPIMYGGGGGATPSSGYLAGQLMTAAQLVYGPIIDNAILALEAMIPFMWQLIERRPTLKRKVYVWGAGSGKGAGEWLGLGPDDIDGYYACNVKLKPLMPMDKFAERQSAIQMMEAGLWTDEEALIQTGNEQPEEMLMNVTARQTVKSEQVMNEVLNAAMAKKFPKPPPPPVPPPPTILGPDGMPMQQGNPAAAGPMPGQMPGGDQFMPQLPDLTRPPQMGAQVPNPMPQQGQ